MKGQARGPRGLSRAVAVPTGKASALLVHGAPEIVVVGGSVRLVWHGVPGLDETAFAVGSTAYVQELDTGINRGWGVFVDLDSATGRVALSPSAKVGFTGVSPTSFSEWFVALGAGFSPPRLNYRCEGVASGSVLAERAIGVVNESRSFDSISFVFDSGFTPDGTNNCAIRLKRYPVGGPSVDIITFPLTPGGSGTITAFANKDVEDSIDLIAGDVLTLEIIKAGAGATVPPFVVVI